MSRFAGYGIALLVLALGCIGYLRYARYPTAGLLTNGPYGVIPAQRNTLIELLGEAGIDPRNVRLVEAGPDAPCWRVGWRSIDTFLRIPHRFDAGGEDCVGLDRGEVVSLSLVDLQIAETRSLAQLTGLRTLQLRNAGIERFDFLPGVCGWEIVILQGNALASIDALHACAALRELDVSFNRLAGLADLNRLAQLETLRADHNEIVEVGGLAGHPALREVNLQANRLTSLASIEHMPGLETLDVAENELASLGGLADLPALSIIRAGSNRIETVDRTVLDRFPMLRELDLSATALNEMPDGYRLNRRHRASVSIGRVDGALPAIEIIDTPLASMLQDQPTVTQEARGIVLVDSLPPERGQAHNVRGQGNAGGRLTSNVNYAGTVAWIDGTYKETFQVNEALAVVVQASVKRGRLRAYLGNQRGGYKRIEATPDQPLELTGRLIPGDGGYFVFFESVDGRAEGVLWSVR